MIQKSERYDVALIGGGLAGLALSILLSRAGYRVILFEKEAYPFHKVCGEYISFESWNFLEDLGVPLSDWSLPVIRRLLVTSPGGRTLEHSLPLGGFGISRYKLDATLAGIARMSGVTLKEGHKVNEVSRGDQSFAIHCDQGNWSTGLVCGCFGKRSNLDVKWKRRFTLQKNDALNHYIAVKYHIQIDHPADRVALHNFQHGYCGISQIEDNRYCLCYLTTAANLQRSQNSIARMEKNILQKNAYLQDIFTRAVFLYAQPLTISQISFERKLQVENGILFLGDAAGMITPLCGNGMSMALHGAKMAFGCIDDFLQGKLSRSGMENCYRHQWQKLFGRRLRTGRVIQGFFGNPFLSDLLITTLKPFPAFVSFLVKRTHGEAF